MTRPIELLREGRKDDMWQMCCGFLDLTLEQFMAIQRRLMQEQLQLLRASELGRKLMRGAQPTTIEEFRNLVPLTTYDDYIPELTEKREDTLPAPVAQWVRTSGYTGKYETKWIPLSQGFVEETEKLCGAIAILCLADHKGDMSHVREHLKVLSTFASPPYASGVIAGLLREAIGCDYLPSNADQLGFVEKVRKGFDDALNEGLDGFGGLPSVLVTVGEQLKQQSGKMDRKKLLRRRRALVRVLRGLIRSKLARRSMLPRDLWNVGGILGGGTDSAVFKKRVFELWGRAPLEIYAGSEGGIYAVQT
ncbi:MAG: GH3 family domain-containing protein, partial [Chloroflexota bacterium]